MTAQGPIGIGYEGLDLPGLIDRLRLRGVTHVVDVRLNPISRKRGLSKTALREGLEAAGIDYSHLRSLGNPKANRDGFATVVGPEARSCRDAYRTLLETRPAQDALDQIRALNEHQRVALLCFEADEPHCHRELVLEALRSPSLALVG
ncbi:DUF488 domain-containing protein [Curtobacterium sp. ISL-83]|uniref:DUF488 domain-containing protein n=1 Tax=Curtobacterium sp. ISL-83 TaxID=2819145 RepID=UPI001BED0E2E|nr:DUF488 domain-containing protein [Curtobacterium sp. ISL-83]